MARHRRESAAALARTNSCFAETVPTGFKKTTDKAHPERGSTSSSWRSESAPTACATTLSTPLTMQRAPCVFRVASSLCPMRVRSRSVLKRLNTKQTRERQGEKDKARRILESGPLDLESLELAYPPSTTPEFVLKNGWCPPPESKPDLPFQVARTGKGGFIPVYRDIKNGRTRIVTIVKKASGDMGAFTSDLSKICQGGKVEARGGELRIEGDHATNVKRWLSGLGF